MCVYLSVCLSVYDNVDFFTQSSSNLQQSLSGLSAVSQRSLSSLSVVSQWSLSSHFALLAFFKQSEPKILRLVNNVSCIYLAFYMGLQL